NLLDRWRGRMHGPSVGEYQAGIAAAEGERVAHQQAAAALRQAHAALDQRELRQLGILLAVPHMRRQRALAGEREPAEGGFQRTGAADSSAVKPHTVSRYSVSTPPASAMSHRPSSSTRRAAISALAPEVHAVDTVYLGPWAPTRRAANGAVAPISCCRYENA